MNARQKSFCEHYVGHHNGARAALEAGYSNTRNRQQAVVLLQNPECLAYIAELDAEITASLGVDAHWLADRLKQYVEGGLNGSVPAMSGVRSAEVLAQMIGLTRAEPPGEPQQVRFTLHFDRELE